MIIFSAAALYLCLGSALLVIWPLALHPTLGKRTKLVLSMLILLVLLPGALLLYGWLGVPQLAAL